jgi:hypothetical protein
MKNDPHPASTASPPESLVPGAQRRGDFWDFDSVKTPVLFCNGAWCGQSSTTIQDLRKIGYSSNRSKFDNAQNNLCF